MLSLAAKLSHLIRRWEPDRPTNSRQLSAATKALPGYDRGLSHTAIDNLREGKQGNIKVSSAVDLADVLGAPAAFLLPGYDDLLALYEITNNPWAVEIVRHLRDMPDADQAQLLADLRARRVERGLPADVPPEHIEEVPREVEDRKNRDRRKKSPKEIGQLAADTLEGL